MSTARSRVRKLVACWLLTSLLAGCSVYRGGVQPLSPARPPAHVQVPTRAHLLDGRTVVFADGFVLEDDELKGDGLEYDLQARPTAKVTSVSLEDVAALESFDAKGDTFSSVAGTVGIAALATVGAGALAVAIFGSCPTWYSGGDGHEALEAESFSYSIAPLFETRDVDALAAGPEPGGSFRLRLRNEALETHFINHVEVLAVDHDPDEVVAPMPDGRTLAFRDPRPAARVTDRTGRDVSEAVAAADGLRYRSAPRTLQAAADGAELLDHVDLRLENPERSTSLGLHLRARNSLLTTVLLYDVLLGGRGANALDWLARDMNRVGPVLQLGQWYVGRMGLRVSVRDGDHYRETTRIPDSGPIAWEEIAVLLETPPEPVVDVRLSFVADSWVIDQASYAWNPRVLVPRAFAPDRVLDPDGNARDDVLESLLSADGDYLRTVPGDRLDLHFDLGDPPTGMTRSLQLATQGYYVEWIRPEWIRRPPLLGSHDEADDDLLIMALQRWQEQRDTLRPVFENTRIPTR